MGNQNFITIEKATGFLRRSFTTSTLPYNGNVAQGKKNGECVVCLDDRGKEKITIPVSMSQLFYAFQNAMKRKEPLDVTRAGVKRIQEQYPELKERALYESDIKAAYGRRSR